MHQISRLFCAAILMTVLPLTTSATVLQLGTPQQKKKTLYNVIALKHTDADFAVDIISKFEANFENPVRFAVDQRTNSIIISGAQEDLKVVAELIEKIDVPVSDADKEDPSRVLKILSVESGVLDHTFAHILDTAFGDRAEIAIDEERNKIVATSNEKTLKELESFLATYSRIASENREKHTATNIRLYWLVSDEKGGELPEELNDVVQELEKLKIGDLRVATLINIAVHDHFEISGSSRTDEEITLEFEGNMNSDSSSERKMAEIQIRAEKHSRTESGKIHTTPLGHLSTSVNAPLGHFVVLGTSTIQKRNSVFVLQFLPTE